MTRHLDADHEERQSKRRDACVNALEYELPIALRLQDIEFYGFSVKYDDYECLMTLKADVHGVRSVAFVASDGPVGCVIKATKMARAQRLRWKEDAYKVKLV